MLKKAVEKVNWKLLAVMEVKNRETKKLGSYSKLVFHARINVHAVSHKLVGLLKVTFLIAQYPLMLVFLTLLPLQLAWILLKFGYAGLLIFVALVASPMIYTINQREKRYLNLLLRRK